ncbi:NAD(+)/NADH kinase [Chloroflexota bacterium]
MAKKPQTIGVLAHPTRPATTPLAEEIAASLDEHGLATWVRTGESVEHLHDVTPGTDMVVAIGGDGAMLWASRICAPFDVPVLGINVGRLGFLTEVRGPKRWPSALEALLRGDYWIEERMMLGYAAYRGDRLLCSGNTLNDVVIGRGAVATTIWLETYIDKGWTTTYSADALIIATASGSTAYALAVGGPILPPELRNILVTPVAPHLSMDRPIILAEGAVIDVFISEETRADIALSADGLLVTPLRIGDRVTVQAGQYISRFVRLRERGYFYRSLLDRLEPRHPARQRPQSNKFNQE